MSGPAGPREGLVRRRVPLVHVTVGMETRYPWTVKSAADVKVLLVDDEVDLLEAMRGLFGQFKFKVLQASNGLEALEILAENQVDVILSDVRMPKMNGIELLARVRAKFGISPCVLIASGHSNYSADVLYDLGANGFFEKPIGAISVRDAITRAVIPLNERLATSHADSNAIKITRQGIRLDQMETAGHVRLGSGGIFWSGEIPSVSVGRHVHFLLQFEDATERSQVEGLGTVKWVRPTGGDGLGPGIGIEFNYLTDDCRDQICALIAKQNRLAHIPKN